MAIIETTEFDPEYFVERRIYIDTMTGQQVPESEVMAMRDAEANARASAELAAQQGRERAAQEAAAQAAAYAEQLRIVQAQQAAEAANAERLRQEGIAAAEANARARAEAEAAARAQATPAPTPFGQGMGEARGYPYAITNAYGDEYQRFDANGNLTEYLNKQGKWEKASDIQALGVVNMPGGGYQTEYRKPGIDGTFFSSTYAPMMSPYREDQGGFLGEGGWQNLAKLALTGVTAGLAAPATAAINAATGLGSIGSAALYGGLTGAAGGAITGGGQGALQGGLLGAAGGAAMGALGGGGAEAFPVEAPNANFTGLDAGNFNTWGMGEFQPFAGGDVGLGSGMVTQFNPDGSFVTLAGAPDYTYSVDTGADQGSVTTEQVDPNERVLTAEEAENLMRYNILPADMQTPAGFDLFETPKALLSGEYGGLIKGGLTLGALAAANALRSNEPVPTGGSGLTAAQLQAIVSTMPSMIGQYTAQAQDMGGTGQMGQGYTPAVSQAIAQLFPTFSLPTTGPFYGAGRFGEGYAPNAPIIKV